MEAQTMVWSETRQEAGFQNWRYDRVEGIVVIAVVPEFLPENHQSVGLSEGALSQPEMQALD